jgi:hypothetical protein
MYRRREKEIDLMPHSYFSLLDVVIKQSAGHKVRRFVLSDLLFKAASRTTLKKACAHIVSVLFLLFMYGCSEGGRSLSSSCEVNFIGTKNISEIKTDGALTYEQSTGMVNILFTDYCRIALSTGESISIVVSSKAVQK